MNRDLYGDEKLFDDLLHQAMEHEPCKVCGHEIGREEVNSAEEGVRIFRSRRFRKICMNCRQDREQRAEERRERRAEKLVVKKRMEKRAAKAAKKTTDSAPFVPPVVVEPESPKRPKLDERYWDLIIAFVSTKYPKVSLEEIEAKVRKAREKQEKCAGVIDES